MRLAFLGTPDAAVPTLRALVADGHEVVVVVTRPDRKRGRGNALVPSPVKVAAEMLGVPVVHRVAELATVEVDLGVVVAFGAMVPAAVLERVPMVNVHFSLLPRWRGAAPVERAILAGDRETGVCVMGLEATLDTGPIFAQAVVEIGDLDAATLTATLAQRGAALAVEVLAAWPDVVAQPQQGPASYADKLSKDEFFLSPDLSVVQLARIVRAGRAVAIIDDRRVEVLAAHDDADGRDHRGSVQLRPVVALGARDGWLQLARVKVAGGREVAATDWANGARLREARWSSPAAAGSRLDA